MFGVVGLDEVIVVFFFVLCGHFEEDVQISLEMEEARSRRQLNSNFRQQRKKKILKSMRG